LEFRKRGNVVMKNYQGLEFEELKEEDIKELTQVMTRAFDEDSRIHLNQSKGGPEGYDTGEFLRRYGLDPRSEAYKVSSAGRMIGGAIVWINRKTNENFLGCLFVDVDCQNKGTGKRIWEFLEKEYPNTVKWGTETPAFSRRNHNFYVNKCGFHVVHIDNPQDPKEGSYRLEKVMK
jgi:hypothetical protein